MKVLAIFALSLLPTHATPNKNQHTYHDQSNSSDKGSPTSTYVNNESTYRKNDDGKNKTPPPWANPEWYLCGVGVATLGFIWWQTRATAIAAKATLDSVRVAEKSLVLQFRPKIVVRSVAVTEEADSMTLEFVIVNIGASKAHIVESKLTAKSVESKNNANFLISGFTVNKKMFDPGEGDLQTVQLDKTCSDVIRWVRQQQSSIPSFIFGGFIKYRDDIGVLRSTGIFRKYDSKKDSFIAVDDPNCEYAD